MRIALEAIISSDVLRAADRQRTFLTFVVEEALAGRGDLLKERTIGRRALEQPASYDPRTDPTVRVLAGRVRTSLDRYYEELGGLDPVRIDIPKGTYCPTFRFAHQPPTATRSIGRATVGPTVAVITFSDLTPGEHPAFLCGGFTESVVSALSRYQGIEVIGPLASADPEADVVALAERGDAVQADLILTGSMRTADSLTRVNAQLIEATSAKTRWSATFEDRISASQPFDAEDRIAEKVGALLADLLGVIQLTGPMQPRTSNREVYRAILAYYAYARTLDLDEGPRVRAGLERALVIEPDNPLVLAMLGGMLVLHGVGDAGGAPPSPEAHQRGVDLCRRSMQLLPGNPLASVAIAFDRMLDADLDGARRGFDEILASTGYSPSVRSMCGIGLALSGRWGDGINQLRSAMELSPYHPLWLHGFLSLDALARGDGAEALAEARRVDTPGLVWGPLLRAAAHGARGDVDRRKDELDRLDPVALANALDHDRLLAHSRLPDAVITAMETALVGPGPST